MSSHEFRGNTRRKRRRAGFSQASTRRGVVMYDQHGREWTANVSNRSGMPTGLITPSFSAPWYPDAQYLKVNPDNTSELYIEYERILAVLKAKRDAYHKQAVDYAREKKLPEPKRGEYADEIRAGIGKPPKPLEPAVAAFQGNPYILGETDVVDPRLVRFVRTQQSTAELLESYDFGPWSHAQATGAAAVAVADDVTDVPKSSGFEEGLEEIADEAFGDSLDQFGAAAGASDGDGFDDRIDRLIEDLEEQHDGEATGGRTIAPQNVERAARQAPRRPASTPVRAKHGKARGKNAATRKAQMAGRRTLADGAQPVIGDGSL